MITDDELIKVDNILVELEYWKMRCEKAEAYIMAIGRKASPAALKEHQAAVNSESDKAAYLESLKQKQ